MVEVTIKNAELKEAEDEKEYAKWEIEDAYRTLKRAEEIKQNSELMALVTKEYDKDVKAIKSLADLKKMASEVAAKENESEEE